MAVSVCRTLTPTTASIWHGAMVPHTQTPLSDWHFLSMFMPMLSRTVVVLGCLLHSDLVAMWFANKKSMLGNKGLREWHGRTVFVADFFQPLLSPHVGHYFLFSLLFCALLPPFTHHLYHHHFYHCYEWHLFWFFSGCVDSQPLFASSRQRR